MSTAYETATYIGDIADPATLPSDAGASGKRANAAAEMRKIKDILTDTLGALTGAVTATHTELNYNAGVTPGTVTASKTLIVGAGKDLDALTITTATITTLNATTLNLGGGELIPVGTKMVFYQAAAPNAGWVIDTAHNNKMLRVVDNITDFGGNSGGSDSPIQMTGAQVPQHTHVFTGVAVPAHSHGFNVHTSNGSEVVDAGNYYAGRASDSSFICSPITNTVNTVMVAAVAGHTPAGTNAVNGSNATWDPLYIDVIVCTKQ